MLNKALRTLDVEVILKLGFLSKIFTSKLNSFIQPHKSLRIFVSIVVKG